MAKRSKPLTTGRYRYPAVGSGFSFRKSTKSSKGDRGDKVTTLSNRDSIVHVERIELSEATRRSLTTGVKIIGSSSQSNQAPDKSRGSEL